MPFTPEVLAVLIEDRRSSITRDYAIARRFRWRRSAAVAAHALASALATIAVALDDEAYVIPGH